ncbi:claspin-like [Periophthalmus magnuspinnatus]|uniref:claspin-like n=1 Tax=Periophthalmus magnuspinnatus TaxID=409849 RepID=UPI002436DE61|nr:claspin-like [Periophthalmus magnuspinnatus]
MSLEVSQQQVEVVPAAAQTVAESDSDSGMGSPAEEMVPEMTQKTQEQPADSEEDEDIGAHRKPRRQALRDSDSEEETPDSSVQMAEALMLSASSDEDNMETGGRDEMKEKSVKKRHRINRAPVDSEDEEETEGGSIEAKPKKDKNKRDKSQRHKEKKEKRSKAVEKVKKKRRERGTEEDEEALSQPRLNDSGFPLGDTELFDTGLNEDEEEESLDAIRAAAKSKLKKHKESCFLDEVEGEKEEGSTEKPHRVERKAARASKDAMRQLHSESQRLVRESTLGLPYHIPEPKTIDQFFKKRARPEGPAMALLKSTKYSAMMLDPPPPTSEPVQTSTDLHPSNPNLDLPQPSATSSPQKDTLSQPQEHPVPPLTASTASLEEDQASTPMLFLSESLQEDVKTAEEEANESQNNAISLVGEREVLMEACVEEGKKDETVEVKPKKDKLTRLRELGLEPPPVVKLCPDEGAFVHLDPPQPNSGVELLKARYLRHVKAPVHFTLQVM